MDKLNAALEEAKKFVDSSSKELADLNNKEVKQNVTKLTTIAVQFADQFGELKGSDKKIVALFVANALVSQFTDVKIDETIGDTIDVVVDLSRGKFNIGKMKEVAEDVKEIAEDVADAVNNARKHKWCSCWQ